jgi:hypothetical protein
MDDDHEPTPQSSLVAILLVIAVLVFLVIFFSVRFANEAARGGL